ncbi:MAG: TetR/AcrR family transcriptional regulator [Gammaproteobacteria bacterium]|nr:TetR/AcrR family transcriptional regulator [Gammaproteobacteria bacterium]
MTLPEGQVKRSKPLRAQILDAALALFSTRGYFNTSIQDIQQTAGVAIGSIYNHFGGKETIARALYDELLSQMEALVDNVTASHSGAHDQARAIVEALFLLTESDPKMVAFILNARHREFLVDEPGICSSRPFQKMRDIIVRGMEHGEIRAMEPWVAASLAFGPALRMISLRLDGMVEHPLPSCLDEIWASTWSALSTT